MSGISFFLCFLSKKRKSSETAENGDEEESESLIQVGKDQPSEVIKTDDEEDPSQSQAKSSGNFESNREKEQIYPPKIESNRIDLAQSDEPENKLEPKVNWHKNFIKSN